MRKHNGCGPRPNERELLQPISSSEKSRQEEAERMRTKAERASASISDERQKINTLAELVSALAQQQQWEQAERVSASISDERQRMNTLRELVSALAQQQQWEQAER